MAPDRLAVQPAGLAANPGAVAIASRLVASTHRRASAPRHHSRSERHGAPYIRSSSVGPSRATRRCPSGLALSDRASETPVD